MADNLALCPGMAMRHDQESGDPARGLQHFLIRPRNGLMLQEVGHSGGVWKRAAALLALKGAGERVVMVNSSSRGSGKQHE